MPPGTMDQGVYKCRDNSGCFEMVAICDGRWDCNDGSDEEFDCEQLFILNVYFTIQFDFIKQSETS